MHSDKLYLIYTIKDKASKRVFTAKEEPFWVPKEPFIEDLLK